MCGIAGFFQLDRRESRSNAAEIAARQVAVIRHRGPDGASVHVGPGVTLGHARLAIIDLSAAAAQPMLDATGDIAVVLNGEIYNFESIRAELTAKGHVFRTLSDTEAIIEGYKAWGTDVVHRLRGMFAIALFDRRADRLLLLRDRLGKKPLVYTIHDRTLVFGSEAKAVLAFPGIERRVDPTAIDAYLTFQYVPSDLCAFAGLSKLPPAHMAIVERGRGPRIERYWSLPAPVPAGDAPRDPVELEAELRDKLAEATRLRLVADVPVGAFLSGGVDSSAVVATMAQASSQPVRTFTIGFDDAGHDERRYARMVAERYGTRHEELVVDASAASIVDELAYHFDEPFADASAVPTYFVSRIARAHVTVALSGDGGDECFLGYERYQACRRLERLRRAPRALLAAAGWLARQMPEGADRWRQTRRLRRLAEGFGGSDSHLYAPLIAYFTDAEKARLCTADFQSAVPGSPLHRLDAFFAAAPTLTSGAALADAHTYLPDDLLTKVDIASMASGLEARAPFLDHVVMEWAARIPERDRFAEGEPKSLLKRAMRPLLPDDLLFRPKMGFAVPIDRWMTGELADRLRDAVRDPRFRARGLFQQSAVEALLVRHGRGEAQGYRLWALLMLDLWYRQWIESPDPFDEPVVRRILERTASGRSAAA